MLTSKSLQEFTAARRRAFIEEWLSSLNGRPADLLSFDKTKEQLQLHDSTYKGLQDITLYPCSYTFPKRLTDFFF